MESNDGYNVQEFVAHSTQVNCLCFGPKSNQVLATGGEDHKVNIWRVGSASNIWTLGYNKSPIESLCFDSEELCVVSGAMNGSLKVFDLNVGRLARNLGSHSVNVTSIQYHPYGEFIVSGSVDCTMKVWDVRNKTCIQTYNGHSKELTCVRFSPDGKWVASSSKDGQILLWDLVAGKLINSIKLQPNYVRTFEFNPTEFTLAAVTSARTVKFWDLDTMESLFYTPPESNPVRAIAYSNLGSVLCTAAKDTLKMWELDPTLKLHSVLDTGWDKISDMKISNNFQLVAGSCMSNFVSVWSIDLEQYLTEQGSSQDDAKDDQSGVLNYRSDAKMNNDERSAGQGNQQRLEHVRTQLSQLSSDLGINDNPSSRSDHKSSESAVNRRGHQRTRDNGYSDAASSDSDHSYDQSRCGNSNSKPPRPLPRSDSKYDGDISNCDESDYKAPGKKHLDQIPEVVWDEGLSPADMANSMGESFWNRFKQSGGLSAADEKEEAKRALEAEGLDRDESDDFSDDQGLDEDSVESLKQMLPPSAYRDKNESKYGDSPPRVTDSDGRRIIPEIRGSPSHVIRPPSSAVSGSRETVSSSVEETPDYDILVRELPKKPAVPVFPRINTASGRKQDSDSKATDTDSALQVVGMRQQAARDSNSRNDRAGAGEIVAAGVRLAPTGAVGGGRRTNASQVVGKLNDEKQCEELLIKMELSSGPTGIELAQRLSSLKILRQLWLRGEVIDAIEHLTILSDAIVHTPINLYTLADFLNSIELRENNLNLDSCLKLLPILDTMVNSAEGLTSENVVFATYKSFNSLAEAFGELIRSTRSTVSPGGVDLSREARLNKCNKCHDIFARAGVNISTLRNKFRISRVLVEVLDTFGSLHHNYFSI